MQGSVLSALLATCAVVSVMVPGPILAHKKNKRDFTPPLVFQAAGPTAASIQSMVDEYRAALGAPNGNAPGPILTGGRREINWDGGGDAAPPPSMVKG